MKIALVIGHTSKSKGALSSYFNLREFDFYSEVVKHLTSKVDIYTHNAEISGYTTRIKDTSSKLNKTNYDLIISLHFNSFEPQANGCETLYFYKSKKGKQYANLFTAFISNRTGIKSRGIKALTNKKDRGFAICYYPTAPVILIEPFFGSNTNDCKKIQSPENFASLLDSFIATL